MKIEKANNPIQLFNQGDYKRVVELLSSKSAEDQLPFTKEFVGSLCFSGKYFLAREFFENNEKKIPPDQYIALHFFFALTLTRQSKLKPARRHIMIMKAVLTDLHELKTDLEEFYYNQALAFYHFFIGSFKKGHRFSLNAYRAAYASNDAWAKILATDLAAHFLSRIGQKHRALQFFEEAKELALQSHQTALASTLESKILHEKAFQGQDHGSIQNLLDFFYTYDWKDSYSRASHGLELAKQLSLEGQFKKSESILTLIAPSIYQSEHRVQETLLNLRFAELAYLRGQYLNCFHFVRSAKKISTKTPDKSLELQILGFELKLSELTNVILPLTDKKEILERIEKLKNFGTLQHFHTMNRAGFSAELDWPFKEKSIDKIHRAIEEYKTSKTPVESILKTRYLSLFLSLKPELRGRSFLYLDQANRILVISDQEEIFGLHRELSVTDLKILTTLSVNRTGVISKESLCAEVWGYIYDPIRHDQLIYSAISLLRKKLGRKSHLVETFDVGYKLHSNFEIMVAEENLLAPKDFSSYVSASQAIAKIATNPPLLHMAGLNFRQLKILNLLKTQDYVDVQFCSDHFSVSNETASRDLRELKGNGLLITLGKARATKYILRNLD